MADSPSIEEIKDVVTKTLDNKGVLAKLKAQLRAAVFTTIYEQERGSEDLRNESNRLKDAIETERNADVMAAAALVEDFLQFYELHNTLNVISPEMNLGEATLSREQLNSRFGFQPSNEVPALVKLIQQGGGGGAMDRSASKEEEVLSNTVKRVKPQNDPPTSPKSPASAKSSRSGNSPADETTKPAQKKTSLTKLEPLPMLGGRTKPKGPTNVPTNDDGEDSDDSVDRDLRRLKEVDAMMRENKYAKHQDIGQDSREDTSQISSEAEDIIDEDIDHGIEEDIESLRDQTSPAPRAFQGGPESVSLSNLSMSDRSVDGSMALDDFDHVEEARR